MVGEGVVFQGMRGYTVPPHAPAVACFTMSVTQHIWLKKKYYRVPIFNPVVSEATRLSYVAAILVRSSWEAAEREQKEDTMAAQLPRKAIWGSLGF